MLCGGCIRAMKKDDGVRKPSGNRNTRVERYNAVFVTLYLFSTMNVCMHISNEAHGRLQVEA